MEPGNLFHRILLTISLVASGCFALNVYPMALLKSIRLVLLQKVFINVLAWTITTSLVQLSSPPLYISFLVLRHVEASNFVSLMSIMHFCRVHYMMMSIYLNLLSLLIETPLTFVCKLCKAIYGLKKAPLCLVP